MHSTPVREISDIVPLSLAAAVGTSLRDLLAEDSLHFSLAPLTVTETLLEVDLAGTGPEAITLLESLQGREMTPAESLAVAAAWERQSRWLSARTQAANVAFVGATVAVTRDGQRAQDSRTLELAMSVDCNDTFLKQTLGTGRMLTGPLSATAAALEAGELSGYRARRICEKLAGLPAQEAQWIEAAVLPTAGTIRLGSLTAKLRRLALKARGDDAVAELVAGAANRRVTVDSEPNEPGLLGLHAYLPAETAVAVREALEVKAAEFARADKAARDQAAAEGTELVRRSKDQRLADALAWFCLGPDPQDPAQPARPQVTVQVTVSLPTLLHLRDNPGALAGYGSIPADIARMLAQDGSWQRLVHENVTGYLLDVGNETYRPPAAIRRFIQARDVKDRFPGSSRSARFGDGDHVEPYEESSGGPTASRNLQCLSRIGHIAKTHGGWTCHGDANDVITWTSPHGQTFATTPHDYSDEPATPPF